MAEGGPPGSAHREGQQPPPEQPQPGQQVIMHMNWSHFKPEFSCKPEEDVEVHLLRTNDWMTTHDRMTGPGFNTHSKPGWGLTQPSIPLWVGKMSTSKNIG